MTHPYRLDASGTRALALASELARDVLAAHAAEVDAAVPVPEGEHRRAGPRRPARAVRAAAQGGGGAGPARVRRRHRGAGAGVRVRPRWSTSCTSGRAQAIASSATLAGRDDLLRGDRRGQAPDHARVLGEGLALAVLGAGVAARGARRAATSPAREKSWVTSAQHADSYVSSAQKPGAGSPLESTVYLVRRDAQGRARRRRLRRPRAARQRLGAGGLEDVVVARAT